VTKGETLLDTVRNIEAMHADAIVVRHAASGAPHFVAARTKAAIVNAGDGAHEHPTQALLDVLTMRAHGKRLPGLEVAIIGDILHSRVARSNIVGMTRLGIDVTLVGPPTLLPETFAAPGVRIERDLDAVLPEVDAVMMLRIQRERITASLLPPLEDYTQNYQLDRRRLSALRTAAVILHPGPYNRGVELTDDVLDDPRSRYVAQVGNGVFVRMAVLDLLVNGARAA
jgi:aspartate carbamoyltransferase catalytic subunit